MHAFISSFHNKRFTTSRKHFQEHSRLTFLFSQKSYGGSQIQNLSLERAVASYIGHYKHVIISKGKTLQENWKLKPQSSWIPDQNANYPLEFFFQLCVKWIESDNKLRNSQRGQLTTDGDRNYQINGSQEEISSVHQHIIRTNIRSLVRSNHRDKILLLPLGSAQ